LLMFCATLLLAVRNCDIDHAGVCGFVHRSEYQRRVCCRILWLDEPNCDPTTSSFGLACGL
jgi:hypothetical protein